MTVLACRICGRHLSESNKSKDLCFHHQTPPGKEGEKMMQARDAHEVFVRGAAPKCSSVSNRGKSIAAIDYDGDPRNA